MTHKDARNIIIAVIYEGSGIMRIITISREFASGGREVGKRLADELGFDYYDREIIKRIAEKSSFAPDYVEEMLDKGLPKIFPLTFGRTFSYPDSAAQNFNKILLAEQQIITEIAEKGRDFVIVGRSADIILSKYKPFNIFVYADMPSKILRCRKRAPQGENLSDREYAKRIKKIDSARVSNRELIGNGGWGEKENYNLCLNTTDIEIKEIIPALVGLALAYFQHSL